MQVNDPRGLECPDSTVASLIVTPNQITITLERPLTPGDREQLFCELEEAIDQ